MIDFLLDILITFAYCIFNYIPTLLLMPLGAIGELNDALSEIKWIIGLIPIAIGTAIAFYKKYIQ